MHLNDYAPTMTMARALSVTPVRPVRPSTRTYVLTYIRMYVCPKDVRPLSRILLIRIL